MKQHSKIIQVFEHQVLRVGDAPLFTISHFQQLAHFQESQTKKYFTLLHNGVKFSHYVGALQVAELTIEILPKADRQRDPDKNLWQSVLLDMLSTCRLLKIDSWASAALKLRPNAILDLYFELFLNEVEKLLQQGLIKSYRRKETNLKILKGRLIVSKQLRENLFHRERFYTNHEHYDFDHLLNQILLEGLKVLKAMVLSPVLEAKLTQILHQFPQLTALAINEAVFQKVVLDRKTLRYQTALDIARLLLLNFRPDLKGGKQNLLAILFDMNLLFEEYIYQQLKRQQSSNLIVKRQQQKVFWNRRYLRPDILLFYKNKRLVLDTKWKVLTSTQPSMNDLRQAFVYTQYFETQGCVLIYPKVKDLEDLPPTAFESLDKQNQHFCQVHFCEVLKNGKLNKALGKEILMTVLEQKRLSINATNL